MIGAVFAATLLLAETTPAAAPATTAVAAAPAAPAPVISPITKTAYKVNKDGLVCKYEEVLGSRIPSKICRTPEQMADREAEDRRNLERVQSQFSKSN